MKGFAFLLSLCALIHLNSFSQTTEDFETETIGTTAFSDNGQNFTITNGPGESTYDIEPFASGGWNGAGTDNQFVDNSGAGVAGVPLNDGTSCSFTTDGGTDIYVNSLYLFLSTRTLGIATSTLTITGRRDGLTVYTIVKSAGFSNAITFTPNNGFTFIDFSTEGGSDNSGTAVDELIFSTTGNGDYMAIDAFNWEFAPVANPEIDIEGNSTSIPDGDITPILGDDTDFGNVAITATATNTFTIQNEGSSALTLSGGPSFVSVSGDPGFSIVSQPSGTIAAGGSSTFQVRFTAVCGAPISQDAIVSVSSDDADESPYTFTVDADIAGVDTDSDGIFNPCDPDDDNDGIADGSDPDDTDFNICGDSDGDGCDDCSVTNDGFGALSDSDPANDGADSDCDGICDATDVTDGAALYRGNMLTLNGTTDYASIGNVAELDFGKTDDFTVEAWINSGSVSTAMQIISKFEGSFLNSRGWGFQISGSSVAFYMSGGGFLDLMVSVPTGAPNVKDGLWHHVAVSYDGSNSVLGCTFYVDGVAYAGVDAGGPVASVVGTVSNSESATIGAYDGALSGAGELWEGSLEEVRVWDDQRTQTEIRENRHLTLSGACLDDLDGYWKFNSGSGTTASDYSGNGNNGTFVGTPASVPSQASVGHGVATTHNAIATATNYPSPSLYPNHSATLNFGAVAPGGDIVVTYINQMPVGGLPTGALSEHRLDHWIVNNYGTTNAAFAGTFHFDYQDGGVTDLTLAQYRFHKRGSNETGAWTQNNPVADAASVAPGNNFLEFASVNSFSMFFPSSGISPLPVELVNFTAEKSEENALLNWETVSELNNQGFNLLHSSDAENWTNIGFVVGAGTTTELIEYKFIHRDAVSGINYYQLEQVDFDGQSTMSDVRSIYFDTEGDIAIVPNPNDGIFNVVLDSKVFGNVIEIEILDARGVIVKTTTALIQSDSVLLVNASELTAGVYFIRVSDASEVRMERVVIQ
jgi:hypothetical protein